jgi:hypothetical protein
VGCDGQPCGDRQKPSRNHAGLKVKLLKVPPAQQEKMLRQQLSGTTKKPELYSGLSATIYTENNSKSLFDAAPQIYAYQPHTV